MQYHGRRALSFQPCIVAGPPRSGTTLLQALLCTAQGANPFVGESIYFASFVHPFMVGWSTFDEHTRDFFPEREDFVRYHGDLMRQILNDTWDHLDRPDTLVLKFPELARGLPILAEILPEMKFVLSVRDPRDVVASQVRVWRRADAGAVIDAAAITPLCEAYNRSYEGFLANQGMLGGRVLAVDFQALVRGGGGGGTPEGAALAGFLGLTPRPEALWQSPASDITRRKDSEWFSPLWGRPISPSGIGRFRETLSPDLIVLVETLSGPIASRLGMTLDD